MPLTSKEMVNLLKRNGYTIVGQTGSHMKLINKQTNTIIIVPIHSKDLKKGLEQAILKRVGLKEEK